MPAPKDPQKKEEWKRKISEKFKGRKTWNTGLKYSEDPQYDEYRDKLSKSRTGLKRKPTPEDVKKKISNSLKGQRKGISPSEEHRKSLSKALKGKPKSKEHKENLSKARTGTKTSLEVRQKMSRDRKGRPGTPHTEDTKVKLSNKITDLYTSGKTKMGLPNNHKSGHHESPKAGRVVYRSSYELIVYQSLDQNDKVETYLVEKIKVPYMIDGKMRTYLPDICIIFKDQSQLVVEIKPAYQLQDPINQAKFKAAKALFGDNFEIWTENELQ